MADGECGIKTQFTALGCTIGGQGALVLVEGHAGRYTLVPVGRADEHFVVRFDDANQAGQFDTKAHGIHHSLVPMTLTLKNR